MQKIYSIEKFDMAVGHTNGTVADLIGLLDDGLSIGGSEEVVLDGVEGDRCGGSSLPTFPRHYDDPHSQFGENLTGAFGARRVRDRQEGNGSVGSNQPHVPIEPAEAFYVPDLVTSGVLGRDQRWVGA
ncbi:hypothetical protein GRZ55_19645 [Chelativorans sp. ZYF759]|uniref:hypothetical protein n=1 Tax=Chelativorans sp. ZYF759 TaxID=2692213 RepID=UPI00145FC48D|nr:hypothetical protein [Chelativorans sp. ZYF759]NMG41460.1 hypothetical protein [Chelativorans sp. ZYF759]